MLATDWVTVSSLATAAATLVLAFATFASVRSANRTARAAERSLLAGLRPVLMPSHADDPPQKVGFFDDRWFLVPGSGAIAEVTDEAIYLAASLRNVGTGIAVLHGWYLHPDRRGGGTEHTPIDDFRRLTRDLYIAPAEVGFWQGAFRDLDDPAFAEVRAAIEEPRRIAVEILYGDHELGRRAISLFSLSPRGDGAWLLSVARHWNVDGVDAR
ncbi:MAG TPA: hypothetical protein VLK36_05695 [Gaiellaceae bacterium]|nr:hypothetical protein [Gaiellaceae bacterium]